MRILLVEDEQRLSEAVQYILEKNKYSVDVADNGIDGQDMVETGCYDVIILDRMLPGKEGAKIVKHLRGKGIKTPIILVTAKDTVANRIEGLDAGADDYLVKPFSNDELLARVRALARRFENIAVDNILRVSGLGLDIRRGEVVLSGESIIKLSAKEAQLLELLMRNHGHVLTKDQIFERVWGCESDAEINAVELYIFYLRKKINFNKSGATLETVRGIGYCLKENAHG